MSILITSTQREGHNSAAALSLLKLSLRVGVFFGSTFTVGLTGVRKIFFLVVSETSSLHLIKRVSIFFSTVVYLIPV